MIYQQYLILKSYIIFKLKIEEHALYESGACSKGLGIGNNISNSIYLLRLFHRRETRLVALF